MEQIFSRLYEILLSLPVILIALSVRGLMHGYAAYKLGDPTAKQMGRLSLNPLKHIDPFGFLCLMLFRIGWAKPVSVDARFFKKPKRDMAITALAGPASNFVLAFLSAFLYVFLYKLGVQLLWIQYPLFQSVLTMCYFMITINLGFGVFNLIPIPPLDGSKILYAFLPTKWIFKIAPYEGYMRFALLLLLALGYLSAPIGVVVSFFYDLFISLATGVFF